MVIALNIEDFTTPNMIELKVELKIVELVVPDESLDYFFIYSSNSMYLYHIDSMESPEIKLISDFTPTKVYFTLS